MKPQGARTYDLRLDLLRGIALLAIMLAHTLDTARRLPLLFQLRNFDVPLMVLVSGASFALSGQQGLRNYWAYVRKRALRLAIPGWLFTSFFLLLLWAFCSRPDPKLVLGSYLFWNTFGYTWILRIFLVMGFLAPLLMEAKSRGSRASFLAFLCLLYAFFEIMLAGQQCLNESALKDLCRDWALEPMSYACVLGLGLCLNEFRRLELILLSALALAVFMGLGFYYARGSGALLQTQDFKYPPRLYYLSYAMAVSLALSASFQGIKSLGPLQPAIVWFSRSSLWIYFWHIPFQHNWCWIGASLDAHLLPHFLLTLGLSVLLALAQESALLWAIRHWSLAAKHGAFLRSLFCPGAAWRS